MVTRRPKKRDGPAGLRDGTGLVQHEVVAALSEAEGSSSVAVEKAINPGWRLVLRLALG